MSEHDETPAEITHEDRLLLEMVDRLARGEDAGTAIELEVDRVRRNGRSWLESLGSLPAALDGVAPAPLLRTRLLERVREQAPPAPAPAVTVARPGSPARTRWLPLAAALTLVLGALALWQAREIAGRDEALAALADRLESQQSRASALGETVAIERERLAMATTAGAEFCLLRPMLAEAAEARGTLVLAADRRSWYLRVEGLGPCPEGRIYQVWFLTEGGPVAGPSFNVTSAKERVEIGAAEPPPRFRAVSVTLEAGSEAAAPDGPQVLFADEAMLLL